MENWEEPAEREFPAVDAAEELIREAPIRYSSDLTEDERAMVTSLVRAYRARMAADSNELITVRYSGRRLRRWGRGAMGAYRF